MGTRSTLLLLLPRYRKTQDEGARAGRLRARRRYLVERARDAHIVGLLAGTLGVAQHREALAHLRNLTQAAGKRSYVLALGRPTPAKLANFPEVDVFVLLACPLGALAPSFLVASSGLYWHHVSWKLPATLPGHLQAWLPTSHIMQTYCLALPSTCLSHHLSQSCGKPQMCHSLLEISDPHLPGSHQMILEAWP